MGMGRASTCCVLFARRRAIRHRCCRLAMLPGHSQKCTLPSQVLHESTRHIKAQVQPGSTDQVPEGVALTRLQGHFLWWRRHSRGRWAGRPRPGEPGPRCSRTEPAWGGAEARLPWQQAHSESSGSPSESPSPLPNQLLIFQPPRTPTHRSSATLARWRPSAQKLTDRTQRSLAPPAKMGEGGGKRCLEEGERLALAWDHPASRG